MTFAEWESLGGRNKVWQSCLCPGPCQTVHFQGQHLANDSWCFCSWRRFSQRLALSQDNSLSVVFWRQYRIKISNEYLYTIPKRKKANSRKLESCSIGLETPKGHRARMVWYTGWSVPRPACGFLTLHTFRCDPRKVAYLIDLILFILILFILLPLYPLTSYLILFC